MANGTDGIDKALMAFSAALRTLDLLQEWISIRRQSGEMTPEQEAEWDKRVAERMASAHWKKHTEPAPTVVPAPAPTPEPPPPAA